LDTPIEMPICQVGYEIANRGLLAVAKACLFLLVKLGMPPLALGHQLFRGCPELKTFAPARLAEASK